MSQFIFKYPLRIADEQTVSVPEGVQLLSAQMQGEDLMLWALVIHVLGEPTVLRKIAIYGTGNPIECWPGVFIATVQDPGGFVWHVFDKGPA